MNHLSCRFCKASLKNLFVDLGMSPLANSYLEPGDLHKTEPLYPLRVYVCDSCLLVQAVHELRPDQLFAEYAYFSSYSESWLNHGRHYADSAIRRLTLDANSLVVEIASNDGYLLRNFIEKSIPVVGVEPARNVAVVASANGVHTVAEFFGEQTAIRLVRLHGQADLLIGNNVLGHVPDINDFVRGLRMLLKPSGLITMEFQHLLRLMEGNQFDTIYHEHFSYLSLIATERIFDKHGLKIVDVDTLATHGGSLRIYVRHADDGGVINKKRLEEVRTQEVDAGLDGIGAYADFSERVLELKRKLLSLLTKIKNQRKSIVCYGAPAKGSTLLNYCGIGADFIDYIVDRNPYKQGRFLPGVRIPIYHPDVVHQAQPDYLMILPWNLKDEIISQMSCVREWGGRFIVPIPEPEIRE